MKLLWLDLNCSYAHASLALPAIHAQCCGEVDVSWEAVSATISTPLGTVVEQVVTHKPDILAATAWLFTREYLLHVVGRVKALMPECTVVLGGPEFLGDNEDFLRCHPEIDCVFRGEGETVFPRWLEVRNDRERWAGLPGCCYLDVQGVYRDGGVARTEDFAALRPPETSPFFRWDKPFVQLETALGCFNGCLFCVCGAEKPVRTVPLESVRERLGNIRAHGIREIRLLDRTFNGNPHRAAKLLELFASFPDMRFHLEIHPALLTRKLRELLRKMPPGQLHLEAGIQSLRAPVLEACRREGGLEPSLEGVRFLCGLDNLAVHADLIAGLPHYALTDIYEDIRMLAFLGTAEIQLELLKVLPGTAMQREAARLDIRYAPAPPYEVLRTDAMTVEDLQTARLLSRLLDMYYNARAWQAVTRRLIRENASFLTEFLARLREGEYLDQPLSVEKRGLLLFAFCREAFPAYVSALRDAWETAGLSLRKIDRLM